MGRKIPAKKHRGVKDPLQQQAKRLQSLKGKINAPPVDPDEQPVPRSVTRLFNLQPNSKTINKQKTTHTARICSAPGPDGRRGRATGALSLERAPGECPRAFSLRINNALRQIKDTTDYHDIQAEERRDLRGERMAELRERRRKKKKMKGNKTEEKETDELSRKARRRKEQQEKKMAKEAEKLQTRSEVRYDRVSFGEQAHAPPALAPPRRKPSAGTLPTQLGPCGRRGLLVAAMLR